MRPAPCIQLYHNCTTTCLQVDNRHQAEPVISPEQAVKLCDRNFGIGGDGVSARCACCAAPAVLLLPLLLLLALCSPAACFPPCPSWPSLYSPHR